VCAAKGYDLTVVTDPNVNVAAVRAMEALGAHVVKVDRRDANGGFLQSRIDHIRSRLAQDPRLHWLNQYGNPANALAHRDTTARSIHESFGEIDALVIGVGTSGTLMGCVEYFREFSHAWLESACADEKPYVFVFLDRMLAPWWMDLTESRVVNAHSAVLPHARGMHAVEQVAATGDRERFLRSAGATVHYVDTGVDTGPIIAARRLDDALLHYSVWACKAETFRLAFSMLVRTAYDLTAPASSRPAGVVAAGVPDGEEFSRTTFTSARRGEAERAYLAMRGSRC
jgi:hypothetical protein